MTSKPLNWPLVLVALALLATLAPAADWLHWRGPEQNGVSRGQALPETFETETVGKGNLLWKQSFGGRSAPLVLNEKLYVINGYDAGKLTEGERVLCLDANTGKVEWEYKFAVFHTDIVSSRLGWTSLTADPKAGIIYAHTTAGHILALTAKDGKLVWKRQLTEEFGRVTGYGGRISSPIYDNGLVIVGFVNGSWGDQARGNNRFVAFDSATGSVVWWSSPTESLGQTSISLKGTYYSNPVIANIKGQRLLVTGAADGCIHALKVRTGERVWSHYFSAGVVNPSPVVDGDLVYACHGEENPGGGSLGRVVCLDAGTVTNGKPKIVWDNNKLARRFGLASPALADGKLYVPEDGGELYCFDAKTGKVIWKYKYGTVARGAPLIADGRLYIFEVFGKLSVIKKLGKDEPDRDDDVVEYRFKPKSADGILETNGTPIAVNGKLYFQTLEETYCIGNAKAEAIKPYEVKTAAEAPYDAKAEPAGIMVSPAEVTTSAGQELKFSVKFVDANGRAVDAPADAKLEWSLPQPPLPPTAPPGATPPPALKASVRGEALNGILILDKVPPAQHGVVLVKSGKLTARARVRVAPQLPIKQDFTNVPVGAAPSGWVNTQGKYEIAEIMVDGKPEKVLKKVNTDARPPLARANAYITSTDATNYTIQADLMGGEVGGKLSDMGLVANRYLLVLDGKEDETTKTRELRIVSWEARNRVNKSVPFKWKANTWYRVKFTVEVANGQGTIRGKVWERSAEEPAAWTIEFSDPNPNTEGAAALYGYVSNVIQVEKDGEVVTQPGSPIYYDNVSITPNAKK